jgi:hypothetical protein
MEWDAAWPMIGALLAAVIASSGTYLGVVRAQRETARQQHRQNLWNLAADAYVELINWTAWVEHWYRNDAPDPLQRPLTVTMARTAARISAFGDADTGAMAFDLLDQLRPHVSAQDISGRKPPPVEVRELAQTVSDRAREHLRAPLDER